MSFTPEQNAALDAPLSSANVKSRTQAGRSLSYIEGWLAIAEANRIFGFDGWTRETTETRLVAEAARKIGKEFDRDGKPQPQKDGWGVSYIARVRVVVFAGDTIVTREGIGSGHGIDVDLGLAHESAIKEAETDAMKRALMTFGNPFGLALYDKTQENVERAPPPAKATTVRIAPNAAEQEADAMIAKIRMAISLPVLASTKENLRPEFIRLPKNQQSRVSMAVQEHTETLKAI